MARNYKDEAYRRARLAALRRDGHKCKRCGATRKIQVHHIRRWADYPSLRCDVNNLISLCKNCHKKITGNESAWGERCRMMLNKKVAVDIKYEIWKRIKQNEQDNNNQGCSGEE